MEGLVGNQEAPRPESGRSSRGGSNPASEGALKAATLLQCEAGRGTVHKHTDQPGGRGDGWIMEGKGGGQEGPCAPRLNNWTKVCDIH